MTKVGHFRGSDIPHTANMPSAVLPASPRAPRSWGDQALPTRRTPPRPHLQRLPRPTHPHPALHPLRTHPPNPPKNATTSTSTATSSCPNTSISSSANPNKNPPPTPSSPSNSPSRNRSEPNSSGNRATYECNVFTARKRLEKLHSRSPANLFAGVATCTATPSPEASSSSRPQIDPDSPHSSDRPHLTAEPHPSSTSPHRPSPAHQHPYRASLPAGYPCAPTADSAAFFWC